MDANDHKADPAMPKDIKTSGGNCGSSPDKQPPNAARYPNIYDASRSMGFNWFLS